MITSKANAQWDGTLKGGKGVMKPAHASEIPFSFGSRFEGQPAPTPEELVGAALAGCFSMALSANLEKAGATPKSIKTTADVKFEKTDAGFTIVGIDLVTQAEASGIDAAKFQTVADETKKGCPVSRALAAVPNVSLKATLKPA